MRERLHELLKEPKKFLFDDETLILVKDGQMTAIWNDGEALCEVHGNINDKLKEFLEWLYDENQY